MMKGIIASIRVHIEGSSIKLNEDEPSPQTLGLVSKITISLGDSFCYRFNFDYYRYYHEEKIPTERHSMIRHVLIEKFFDILSMYIQTNFRLLTESEALSFIQSLDEKYHSEAPSHCECEHDHSNESNEDTETKICCKCGKLLDGKTYYIYNNRSYCIDDMYAIVVKASVGNNLTEVVGLAEPDETKPTNYRITETDEFKASVIDKYFNYMNGFIHMYHVYKCEDK